MRKIRGSQEFNEAKIDELMNEYPEFAEVFRNTWKQHEMDKNKDQNEILRVHERFEQIRNSDNKFRKLVDHELDNPLDEVQDEEAEMTSDIDDWEDPNLAEIYMRYKHIENKLNVDKRDIEKIGERMVTRFIADCEADPETIGSHEPWKENFDLLYARKEKLNMFTRELKDAYTKIRWMAKIKKLNPFDMLLDKKTGE